MKFSFLHSAFYSQVSKYFIKEVSYYYCYFMGGEMTTKVVKITHPNKDQAEIIYVYVFIPCPLNPDIIFIKTKF